MTLQYGMLECDVIRYEPGLRKTPIAYHVHETTIYLTYIRSSCTVTLGK
jgi:hypothetical protein